MYLRYERSKVGGDGEVGVAICLVFAGTVPFLRRCPAQLTINPRKFGVSRSKYPFFGFHFKLQQIFQEKKNNFFGLPSQICKKF